MKKPVALMLTFAAALALAAPAAAGERAHAVSVSPFVGGYTFDGVQHLETAPNYGLRLGYDLTKNWGFELVGSYLATEGTRSQTSVNAISYGLDILYNFMPDGPLVPYLAVGGGAITFGHGSDGLKINGRTTDATANAGLGLKYFLTDSVALRGDARQKFLFEPHESIKYNWEYSAGLYFLFGGKAAPAPAPAAPTSSLSVAPASIIKGESATLSWTSQNAANCDIQPGIGSVQPQGSMAVTPSANTAYALSCTGPGGTATSAANLSVAEPKPMAPPAPVANLSAAPGSITQGQTAKLTWTSQNATNCEIQPNIGPVQLQGSMDVTPSANIVYTLTCSGTGGTINSVADVSVVAPPAPAEPPCPVVLTPEQEETVNLLIEFDTNKAVIKPQYYPNVNALGEFMKKYPSCEIKVEGHTDNVGSAQYNMKLSKKRADAVKKYLVDKFGIDPARIKTVGYGESKPVDTNKTSEGRFHNRRVQAHHGAVKEAAKP